MWIVVPVKRFSDAKSRLSPLLTDAERESLAQAMLHDVLGAICGARLVDGFVVVSHEVRARYAAERAGGLFLEESGTGLSGAIRQAAAWLGEHGRRAMLMVPGDVPLVRAAEIDTLIERHQGTPAVTVVPDREGDGTNALAVSPTDAIPFAFGRGSYRQHLAHAIEAGIEPTTLRLDGLALDVDNPLDLRALLTYDSETESLAYLADSGIARRVLPRHGSGHEHSASAAAFRLL